jgi:hypothetical protein
LSKEDAGAQAYFAQSPILMNPRRRRYTPEQAQSEGKRVIF